MRYLIPLIIAVLLFNGGCSNGGSNPVSVVPAEPNELRSSSSHKCFGLWQFTLDPVKQTLEFTVLRQGNLHLNALPFLEPPPLIFLTLESLIFTDFTVEADIGIIHPLDGFTEFTGFDVCGIVISRGTMTDFDEDVTMAGGGDVRLLNPDGYTRWWNPKEFPHTPGQGYTDGLLGTPNFFADYNSIINPYKYFADELTVNEDISGLSTGSRGVFSAGEKNIRRYIIETGPNPLYFNYAVDACWEPPQGYPPWTVPDDFPEEANRVEPYRVEVNEVTNTLHYEDHPSGACGGSAHFSVDVYDWFNAGSNSLECRFLWGFPPKIIETPSSVVPGYATFEFDLNGSELTRNGINYILFKCVSEETGYQGLLPGEAVSSYFIHPFTISDPTPGHGWVANFEDSLINRETTIAVDSHGDIYVAGDQCVFMTHTWGVLSKLGAEGNHLWSAMWGDINTGASICYSVSVDDADNVYVAGLFTGTVDFDAGPGVAERTAVCEDVFLSKFNQSGDLLWNRTFGCEMDSNLNCIATFGANSVYVVGDCVESCDYDPGPGQDIHEGGAFITKFDSHGNHLWARTWGPPGGWTMADSVDVDNYGNAFVVGDFYGSLDFDPGPGVAIRESNGDRDIYGSVFTGAGNWVETVTLGGVANDTPRTIHLDDSGCIYLAGRFRETVDFDPGPGYEPRTMTGGDSDTFLCKFSPSGGFLWVDTWDFSISITDRTMATDGLGNAYIFGRFDDVVDFDPGPGTFELTSNGEDDFFICKIDQDGNLIWTRSWGGIKGDSPKSLAIDVNGNALVLGVFHDTVDFDPGPETEYRTTVSFGNSFAMKVLPDGYW